MSATSRFIITAALLIVAGAIALACRGILAPGDAALASFFIAFVLAPGALATVYARHHEHA